MRSLADVPEPIDMVDIFRASDAVPAIVDEALALDPLPKVIWMQLDVRNDEAAATAEAAGIKVVMNRCPKIEYGRLSGEIGWTGVNSGVLSSKKPLMRPGSRVSASARNRRADAFRKTGCIGAFNAVVPNEFSSLHSRPASPRYAGRFQKHVGEEECPAHTRVQHARRSMPAPSPIRPPARGPRRSTRRRPMSSTMPTMPPRCSG